MADPAQKSKTAYNAKADHYDSTPEGRFTREFQSRLVSCVSLRDGYSVLDIACGTGTLLAAFRKKTAIKGYGIDIADRMIKNAAANNPGMEFHVSRCDDMPFGNATMDVVTICAAYHHFPDTVAFAKEAKRVLKPNGRIYIAEVRWPGFFRVIANPFISLSKEGDVRIYAPKEIVRNLTQSGFEGAGSAVYGHIQIVTAQKP